MHHVHGVWQCLMRPMLLPIVKSERCTGSLRLTPLCWETDGRGKASLCWPTRRTAFRSTPYTGKRSQSRWKEFDFQHLFKLHTRLILSFCFPQETTSWSCFSHKFFSKWNDVSFLRKPMKSTVNRKKSKSSWLSQGIKIANFQNTRIESKYLATRIIL